MLSLQSIREAIGSLLSERFPGETIYHNLVPQDFARPSFLVEIGATSVSDASCGLIELEIPIMVTCFVKTDEYYNSHIEDLEARMMSVQELFCVGYLQVQNRALHVVSNKGQCGFDYATAAITFRYKDDRPTQGQWPLMGAVHTKIKEES